ncbi:MAG: metallophosphoesterase [Parabacteroides sp.]
MNRRSYLKALSAVMATSFLGGCRPEKPMNDGGESATGVAGSFSSLEIPDLPEKGQVFYVVSDLGRNGYYKQKPIAELMGLLAEQVDLDFIVAAGDTHHFNGVISVDDPLWMTNYELIYSHPELMLDWFAINGNHEYRGNTQAVLDYGQKSRRWIAPARYYAREMKAGKQEKLLLLLIDTTPLIDKYREDPEKYPDAVKQDREEQLAWIDRTLAASDAKWKVVVGHHPVYADTPKEDSERKDMQRHLEPLLNKYGVDVYFCGHIHNFQHIQPAGSGVDYVVNSSASLARKVASTPDTKSCSPAEGFTLVSVSDEALAFYWMDEHGKVIYQYKREK